MEQGTSGKGRLQRQRLTEATLVLFHQCVDLHFQQILLSATRLARPPSFLEITQLFVMLVDKSAAWLIIDVL
jgi:hypothetical protein